ncbi:hypothetical protein F5B21DRAFT_332459 [Xylaria acuta]|nr:hypothetical protein F5B21DRAFT_332459 [Xylaria acuta]
MDKISPEIFEHIISLVIRQISEGDIHEGECDTLPYALPTLATVSRKFQWAVEQRTFRSLRIETSNAELSEFERTLGPRRRSHLRHLSITLLVLPRPSKASTGDESESESESCYETDRDRQAHMEASTAPLRRVWNFLGAWDESTTNSKGINLSLSTTPSPDVPIGNGYGYRPFTFSLLDLIADAESFPTLPFIREFDFHGHSRYWNPRAALVLTSTMPKLERAVWKLSNAQYDWGRYYSIDKKYRDNLAQSVQTIRLPSSVKKFSCHLKTPYYYPDHSQVLPRFIEDGANDPVSCAIRELTKHCTEVSLEGPFHPSLFDPPCWQHMTRLNVKVLPCSPDGSWLFRPRAPFTRMDLPRGLIDCTQLPPGYANTEEEREEAEEYYDDYERIVMPPTVHEYTMLTLVPDSEKLNAMITEFARCCARMPALEVADVRFEFENADNWPFQVICIAPFQGLVDLEAGMPIALDSYRMYLHVNEWRPTDATITELKNVGLERNGQPSTICFLPWGDYSD